MAIQKRKKRFFNIELPLIRKSTQLQAFEPKELDGRHIKYDLTRIMKGKSILMTFKIKVKDDTAKVFPKELNILPYFIRRMVRKGTDYVEDSFSSKCKDAQLRIKPFLVTRRRVPRRVRKALREMARAELVEYVKTKDFETLFDEVLKNKIQKSLSLKLKKIYPLSLCEIRVLKVEKFPDEE
jgi:ribosomal protein S3AE